MVCLPSGVIIRLNGDVAHEAQCLAHREVSVFAAAVVMNLPSLNNEAAGCMVLVTKPVPSKGLAHWRGASRVSSV